MFDSRIDEITAKIRVLENELICEFNSRQKELLLRLEDEKEEFEKSLLKEGRSKIISSIKYVSSLPIGATLTIPFIWAMILPIIVIDLMVSIFQAVCFPIYKIPKVKRKDHVVIDRYNLFYLGRIEKINCLYCEYFNGVTSYVREIAARTEQFWCPIKHSRPLKDNHSRYGNFFNHGDYLKYKEELNKIRKDFKDIEDIEELH
ncbi:hypothetical protein [Sulfurimonas sp.]|uniref:hypothetical protein n=1 Tax=Sulfurimonas sp. TaxID=2022749 RepID=UPI003566557C